MRHAADAFAKLFTPHDGGYIYFPSHSAGGKFVTEDEYQALLVEWKSVASTRGTLKLVAALVLAAGLGSSIDDYFELGGRFEIVFVIATGAIFFAYVFWISRAPRRLVKGRDDLIPPRSLPDTKRVVRSMISWRHVLPIFLASGMTFAINLSSPPETLSHWLWLIGSGGLIVSWAWIAIRKWHDRMSA